VGVKGKILSFFICIIHTEINRELNPAYFFLQMCSLLLAIKPLYDKSQQRHMCDVPRQIFARQLHLATSRVERTVNFCEWAFVSLVALNLPSLKRILAAPIWAADWVLPTLGIVGFDHILKCGVVGSAVVTGERALPALLGLVGRNVAALEPLPTLVCTLYRHKLTLV
jgi:hypothetical protein